MFLFCFFGNFLIGTLFMTIWKKYFNKKVCVIILLYSFKKKLPNFRFCFKRLRQLQYQVVVILCPHIYLCKAFFHKFLWLYCRVITSLRFGKVLVDIRCQVKMHLFFSFSNSFSVLIKPLLQQRKQDLIVTGFMAMVAQSLKETKVSTN